MEINTNSQNVKVHFSIEVVVEYNGQFFVGRVVDEPGTLLVWWVSEGGAQSVARG